jgi:hypothetical protein
MTNLSYFGYFLLCVGPTLKNVSLLCGGLVFGRDDFVIHFE